jgi:hypothetical protein
MGTDVLFLLFEAAGAAMLTHIVLSQLLRFLVKWNSPLAAELFAVPNAAIAPDWGFRLLRVRYFVPWRSGPTQMHSAPFVTKLVFFVTRITGLAMPILVLSFFAGAFYVAGRA